MSFCFLCIFGLWVCYNSSAINGLEIGIGTGWDEERDLFLMNERNRHNNWVGGTVGGKPGLGTGTEGSGLFIPHIWVDGWMIWINANVLAKGGFYVYHFYSRSYSCYSFLNWMSSVFLSVSLCMILVKPQTALR